MLTPAQQQLRDLNIKKIFGSDLDATHFEDNVDEMLSMNWLDFLDEDIADNLSPEQFDALADFFSREDAKPEDLTKILRLAVPDFDERFQQRLMKAKEGLVRSRLEMLAEELIEPENQSKIAQARQLVDNGEWKQVEQVISELNEEL